jgi:ubiquinone/menaquinone biosynthesis C-methylase UbiE
MNGLPEPSGWNQADFYEAYPRVEEQFQASLDASLHPRGPEALYDMVSGLGFSEGARVLDIGCGEGDHAVRLAQRFGYTVHGIDPVPRHVELARATLADAEPALAERVSFTTGSIEALPVADASVNLVWCRDVLVHVSDLEAAFAEFRRVLAPRGSALVYQLFATDLLEPAERRRLFATMGVVESSTDVGHAEAAMTSSGLRIEQCVEYGPEWGEAVEERGGTGRRRLLHTARLLREPRRYVEQFGQTAYDIMLADCLWHVYRMIGKLSGRAYLLVEA